MKGICFLSIGILLSACSAADMYSPGKEVSARLFAENGGLYYAVMFNGDTVIGPSPAGIVVDGDTLGKDVSLKLAGKEVIDEAYPVRGFHTEAVNQAVQYTYDIQSPKGAFRMQTRLYDDGFAFRYIVPGNGHRVVQGELTTFSPPRNLPVWFFERTNHWKLKSYAGEWLQTKADSLHCISPTCPVQGPPLLYELPQDKYMCITEAALYNYSGMRLKAKADASLQADFTEQENGFTVEGDIITPWRVVMLCDNLNELVNSDIITHLNPAPDPVLFADPSWIKPGRAVWSWWDGSKKEEYLDISYEKHLIDNAATLTYEYTLIDGGWETKWKDKWTQLCELCEYAANKNVKVFVWKHSGELIQPENDYEQMRLFLDSVKQAGAVGIKIDYMNGESKTLIDFDIRALQLCAERRLMVDFHGCQKPSGESGPYPNEITREGIRGLELNKMNEHIPGKHNVALVFTRCILNNADYTPVGFSNPGNTSWAHQLATAYLFTSPLLVIAEHTDTLLHHPVVASALPLIKTIPTVWDETLVLPQSRIAETAILARRCKDVWYVAILNGEQPKQITLSTEFLKEGLWTGFFVEDDPSRQKHINTAERPVQAGEFLTIRLNGNGGYVARFIK
ncbi:MAG: glycoside hydrolase family 97 protein [Tannerella sp.]|jgi:alpha-glucosidase|nr:glycoside hydrolase family 97 protein [Tannerella sp.]